MSVMENKVWRLWFGGFQQLQLMSVLSDQLLKSSEMQGISRNVDSAYLLYEDLGTSTRYTNGFYIAYNETETNLFCISFLGWHNKLSKTG